LLTSLDTVPQGLNRVLSGSGLIFRTQQEIRNVHHLDLLVLSAGLFVDAGVFLYCESIWL